MAEISSKRPRDETHVEEEEDTKRHRSFRHVLSLLEAEEEEPLQDISSLITTLQQELSSEPNSDPLAEAAPEAEPNDLSTAATTLDPTSSPSPVLFKDDADEEEKGSVIRHLLEASDDELGIPQREIRFDEEEDEENNGGLGRIPFFDEGLWELEDVTANYYTLLQSQLFMEP